MTHFSRHLSILTLTILLLLSLGCRAVNLQGDVPSNTAVNRVAPAQQTQPVIEPTQPPAQDTQQQEAQPAEQQQTTEQQPAQPAEQQVQVEPTAVPAQPASTDRGSHIVAFGETLGTIAEAYGVPVELLAQVNGITNINYIDANQQLVIPSADEVGQWNNNNGGAVQVEQAQPATDPAVGTTTTYDPNNYFEHTIQYGESLGYLALVYNISIADLAAYNGIANVDDLDIGQVIRIPNR